MELIDQKSAVDLFAAGAFCEARRNGASDADAADFAVDMCKSAASGKAKWDEDDDDEDTWWSRNKSWLIPTLVGGLAFYAGADGERNTKRKDRSYIANAFANFGNKLGKLLGVSEDPLVNATTKTDSAL